MSWLCKWCSVASAMGNLDSSDINNLLNAGVSVSDVMVWKC